MPAPAQSTACVIAGRYLASPAALRARPEGPIEALEPGRREPLPHVLRGEQREHPEAGHHLRGSGRVVKGAMTDLPLDRVREDGPQQDERKETQDGVGSEEPTRSPSATPVSAQYRVHLGPDMPSGRDGLS